MNTSWRRVDQSQIGSDTSASIRSKNGYILKNNDQDISEKFDIKHITKNDTFFKTSSENTLNVASEKKTTEMHNIEQLFTTCESNMQSDEKNTEKYLKRFEQEYNDLMKQKNEIKFTKYSIGNKVTKTSSPNTELIESSNLNEHSSTEVIKWSSLNLNKMNLNKIEELVKPDQNSIHSSYDMPNANIKHFSNKDILKKYENHNVGTYNDSSEKYKEKYNEEINNCFIDVKLQQRQVLSSNIKFHEILDGLNNEIIKIKDKLIKNKETDSLNLRVDTLINESKEIFSVENCNVQDVCKKGQQNTFGVQMFEKSGSHHEYNFNQSKSRQYLQSNQYTQYSNIIDYQNNSKRIDDEQLTNDQQKKIKTEEKTAKGFYQIQTSNHKTENLIRIKHFFSSHNPCVCQCGMISNNK